MFNSIYVCNKYYFYNINIEMKIIKKLMNAGKMQKLKEGKFYLIIVIILLINTYLVIKFTNIFNTYIYGIITGIIITELLEKTPPIRKKR